MDALWKLGAVETARRVRGRDLRAEDAVGACLDRIAEVDGRVGAYVRVDRDGALEAARAIDRRVAAGEDPGRLAGVPVSVKDVLAVEGAPTTCGSAILEPFVSPFDATAVARLRAEGAIVVGQTNMDEFAMGSSTESSHYGPTRNPWDLERVPGGSSGGAAAAVAAGTCAIALGSDTGGSIRQPASFCGTVGLKPTYGRVSRYGLVAFASSLDQVGPLTRNVEDAALALEILAGPDPRDSTSLDQPVPGWSGALDEGIEDLRIGVPAEGFGEGVDEPVASTVRAAIDRLAERAREVVEVSLPHTPYGIATYYILAPAEASSNLARYDGVRYGRREDGDLPLGDMYRRTRSSGFGEEVKRRILIGTYVLSAGYYDAYYRKAQQVRTLIRRDFETAFETCDAIVLPVAPTPAFPLGSAEGDPLKLYRADALTVGLNLAGLPGISVPCGEVGGLPVGLQVAAPALREDRVLRVASAWEAHSGWRDRTAEVAP